MTNTTTSYYQLEKDMTTILLPVKEFKYNAYKNGTCATFDTDEEARAFSNLVEKIQSNKEEHDIAYRAYCEQRQLIYDIWMKNVREYFNNYSPAEIDLMYSYGYDRGHSSGYDAMFDYMEEFSAYVDELKELWNKEQ